MLHVTKKCWGPFTLTKDLRGGCSKSQVSQSIPENGWAFLTKKKKKNPL